MTSIAAMMCPALTWSALGRPPPVPAANKAANAAAATEVPRVSTNRTPVVAGVVRDRRPGEPVLAALLRFVLAELDARAEWTALHDGVTQFTRMSMASTALSEAFARQWDELQAALAQALWEICEPGAAGESAPATEEGADATAERSRAETTAAFALLESGLGRFPD